MEDEIKLNLNVESVNIFVFTSIFFITQDRIDD